MTLKELTEEFETGLIHDDYLQSNIIVDIASGGLQLKGAQPPVLCDTKETALDLWGSTARQYQYGLPAGTKFRWIEKPTLDLWKITITDARGTHRLVSDRFTVFARIIVAAP